MLQFLCQTTSKDVFNWLPFSFSFFGVSAITVLGDDIIVVENYM